MATANLVTPEAIINALRNVLDPDLGKDLVTLGMIQDVKVSPNGDASFRVVLTTPACPLKAKIESDCRQAVQKVTGVAQINIKMDAVVRGQNRSAQPGQTASLPGIANIIAVSSGKGGVGKSTVAVNLAVGLAREGARVGLLDADVYGPNIPTMLGLTDQARIEKGEDGKDYFIPPMAHGVKVMSMGFLIPADQPLIWRGPMLHSVINQFCFQVNWGELDYLVVDMPPGTGDVQLSLAQLVPVTGAVLVTTPQEVSTQDVRRAFAMFEKVKVPVIGVVENMSYFICDGCDKKHFIFGSEGGKNLAQKFGTELLAEMPLSPSVREGGDLGNPVVEKDTPAGLAFTALAQKIAQKVAVLTSQVPAEHLIQIGKFF